VKGYRTIIFNILSAILPVMEISEITNLVTTYGGTIAAGYVLFVTVGNAILRFLTDTKIGEAK